MKEEMPAVLGYEKLNDGITQKHFYPPPQKPSRL